MNLKFIFDIKDELIGLGLTETISHNLNIVFGISSILLAAFLADVITKKFIKVALRKFTQKTTSIWDDILLENKVFDNLAHLAPAIVLFYSIDFVLNEFTALESFLKSCLHIYMIIIGLITIRSFLNALHNIYLTLEISKEKPIKGLIQIAQIFVYFIGSIFIISIIVDKSPGKLFAGLGAAAAILLLVFKDTILGFVAGIQLSANNMLRVGDAINMPSHNADGEVIDISINTVKVQNYDKTITTIPTYALVSGSFSNWRGMKESGVRRIKRHINIDMQSVHFLSADEIQKLKEIHFLKDYISQKEIEIMEFNIQRGIDNSNPVNGRRMTNLGVFRAYLENYLRNHPKINTDNTLLVRQLQTTEKGIPLEIYAFSNDQDMATYEQIQSDIFDHLLAVIPEFGLKVFQSPTGSDIAYLGSKFDTQQTIN